MQNITPKRQYSVEEIHRMDTAIQRTGWVKGWSISRCSKLLDTHMNNGSDPVEVEAFYADLIAIKTPVHDLAKILFAEDR